jgi:AbrB family looped-hinge helix DNA binding protein
MTTATVGQRFQVVIPRAERRRLGLRPSSRVNVEASDRCIVLYPVTNKGMRGIGKDLAAGMDATEYVKKLRAEWDSRA